MNDFNSKSTIESYSKLISLAVHEFRSPASVVGGYLRMLKSGAAGALSDPQKKMVGEAEKSYARLMELVAELSDIGKLDGGTAVVHETTFEFFQLIEEVASDMHEAEDREVTLTLRGESAGSSVSADRARLSSAIRVVFRAVLREQPSGVGVVGERILDRAAGSPRAVLVVAPRDRVQETYAAPPGVLDELRGGLGLGLPLARRVVERAGGRLWTPSMGPGVAERQGLVVSLPLLQSDRSDKR